MGYLRLAVARDAAFCFYYNENLRELARAGLEPVFFSPLSDRALPEDVSGLYIGGGYPELHAEGLSANSSLMVDIRQKAAAGLPVFAECGGFMYLTEKIIVNEVDIKQYAMCAIIKDRCRRKGSLVRFGYVNIRDKTGLWLERDAVIRGHEFHYYDADDNGDGAEVVKASDGSCYDEIYITANMWAGWPHLYLPGSSGFAESFEKKCRAYHTYR